MSDESATVNRAYHEIRAHLTDGRRRVGELLVAEAVAAELELPVPAVDAAFERLQAEDVVRIHPSHGALVLPLGAEEARAVMEARLLLEVFALDSVAARGRADMRELGRELAAGLHGADTSQEALDLARKFHTRLVAAAGNPVVERLHADLWDRSLHVTAAATFGPGHPQRGVAEHRAVAEALAGGRGAEARRLLHEHVSEVLRRTGVGEDFALPRPADR